jgi:hypothetical protein
MVACIYISHIYIIVVCTAVDMQLLRNRRIKMAISEQQLRKHVPAATNTQAAVEERCFLCGPCREIIPRTVGAMSGLSSAREAGKWCRCN